MHSVDAAQPSGEWAARLAQPARSVFGNFASTTGPASPSREPSPRQIESAAAPNRSSTEGLQAGIDVAIARSFLYRYLALAYEGPEEDNWAVLTSAKSQGLLDSAVRVLGEAAPALAEAATAFRTHCKLYGFEPFLNSCLEAFGHAARGRCPLNEIEYGDLKADPLFQPHRLADLAAFYRAFGLQVADDADERHDHICLELEFMSFMAAKEAYALEHQLDPEDLVLGRNAQRRFLREHLGRWTPALARRLVRMAADSPLGALANLTRAFIEAECVCVGVVPGSEDLLLRPADEAAESLCSSCGASHLPPRASAPS